MILKGFLLLQLLKSSIYLQSSGELSVNKIALDHCETLQYKFKEPSTFFLFQIYSVFF